MVNAWLGEAAAEARRGGRVRAVIGNEASDLDSMSSAVVYAFFLARGSGQARGSGDGGPPSLPVIPIPRADFGLRTEAVWLFREAGLDVKSLVFLDEIDLNGIYTAGGLRLVLVDHNKLSAAHEAWAPAVEEILDHHADEGLYPGAKKTIAPVGSCATLVAERMLASAPLPVDRATGTLLLGTILLDTVNLDPEAKRVTPRDEQAAAGLLAATGADRKTLFDRLQAEKFNVSDLSSRDILRKDYKEYRMGGIRCGISSALLPLRDWVRKDPGIEASFRGYAEDRGLDLLLIMSAYTQPEFRREMALYAQDDSLRERVASFLNRSGLGLTPLESGAASRTRRIDFYTQADLSRSRKRLQPLLEEYLGENTESGRPAR